MDRWHLIEALKILGPYHVFLLTASQKDNKEKKVKMCKLGRCGNVGIWVEKGCNKKY